MIDLYSLFSIRFMFGVIYLPRALLLNPLFLTSETLVTDLQCSFNISVIIFFCTVLVTNRELVLGHFLCLSSVGLLGRQ